MTTLHMVFLGIACGTAARLLLLRVDYRQYPSLPQGVAVHGTLGLVAAAMGAVALPALMAEEYAAVTFLALAAQQFRDVRQMERNSLMLVETLEMAPRGAAYIEDISRRFEARNYVAMLTALASESVAQLSGRWYWGVLAAVVVAACMAMMTFPKKIRALADVKPVELHFEGPLLMAQGLVLSNVGLPDSRKRWQEYGIACVLHPKDDNARAQLTQPGQRQAMVHDTAVQLGTSRSDDEGELAPMAKFHPTEGYVVLAMVVAEPDQAAMVQALMECPVLESASRHPLESKAGRMAKD